MQVNGALHGIEKTRVIKAYKLSVYGIDFSSNQANKAMITKTKKTQTLDQSSIDPIKVWLTRVGWIKTLIVQHELAKQMTTVAYLNTIQIVQRIISIGHSQWRLAIKHVGGAQ